MSVHKRNKSVNEQQKKKKANNKRYQNNSKSQYEKTEQKNSNRTKNQIKKGVIYVIGLILAIYIIYVIYLLIKQPTNVFMVDNGELYDEETDVGYVIRDEKVVKGENYKNGMEQIIAEGSKAAKNENIFRYYSNNEENLKNKISELDGKIQEAMDSESSSNYSSDAKILENQIDQKIQDINKITDTSTLEEYKKDIDALVVKKAKIAGESSPQGSYLRKLIDERKQYETELNTGAEYVKAPISGIVSYRVDGLEDVLTPNNIDSLTKEYLDGLNLSTGKVVASSTECGKVIDNFKCYIATISSSDEAKNAKVGDKIKVRLSNNKEIDAEITNINKNDEDNIILVLEVEKEIEELINYRKITFTLIWWSSSGLKIPNQAILQEDNLNYVIRNRAGYLSKILVKVKKQGERYSIVESYTNEELKELGLSSDEISSNKKLTIYDEILVNPSENMLK